MVVYRSTFGLWDIRPWIIIMLYNNIIPDWEMVFKGGIEVGDTGVIDFKYYLL